MCYTFAGGRRWLSVVISDWKWLKISAALKTSLMPYSLFFMLNHKEWGYTCKEPGYDRRDRGYNCRERGYNHQAPNFTPAISTSELCKLVPLCVIGVSVERKRVYHFGRSHLCPLKTANKCPAMKGKSSRVKEGVIKYQHKHDNAVI